MIFVLMYGRGGSTNHTFTHDNPEAIIYYLNLYSMQKVADDGAVNVKINMVHQIQKSNNGCMRILGSGLKKNPNDDSLGI